MSVSVNRSPTPPLSDSPIARSDLHADETSEDENGNEDDDIVDEGGTLDDSEEYGIADDVDQVDSSGHVLNDGEELLDQNVVAAKTKARVGTENSATQVVSSASASVPTDGSRQVLYLCPSSFGRPSVVYFDYPLAFGIRRDQNKEVCEKNCTLRYKHADSACIYNSITGTLKRAGFLEQLQQSSKSWNVRWGKHMLPDSLKELKAYQKINHFPGTGGIGRKDRLARNIARAKRLHGAAEYNFLPETYLLPADRSLWEMKFNGEPTGTLWICKRNAMERKHRETLTLIVSHLIFLCLSVLLFFCLLAKPNSSSCGRGIRLVSKLTDIPVKRSCVISRYIANPLLVDNHKFDLRIYVLVTSFHPLKIYLYGNGLARFCTSKYDVSKKNLKKKYIHLTNFSVNKKSPNFVKNTAEQNLDAGDDGGDSSKWSLMAFKKW